MQNLQQHDDSAAPIEWRSTRKVSRPRKKDLHLQLQAKAMPEERRDSKGHQMHKALTNRGRETKDRAQ